MKVDSAQFKKSPKIFVNSKKVESYFAKK